MGSEDKNEEEEMSRAVTCPVCNGTGRHDNKSCHGCYGSGWIEIEKQVPLREPIYHWPAIRWTI